MICHQEAGRAAISLIGFLVTCVSEKGNQPMFHVEYPGIRDVLLKGQFGLERESLRIDENGFLSHTFHPFPENIHIVRDFCENQTEINTPITNSPDEAVDVLAQLNRSLQIKLYRQHPREILWPFSNPPYIRGEEDIPIAKFTGSEMGKTAYREYLSKRYGRYKMSFSGIHVNFSFDEELLRRDFALGNESDYPTYKNQVYLSLAQRMIAYGWLLVALTAASPLMDSSFTEKGKFDGDIFYGMASVRCSELGYWNYFTPVLNYGSLGAYTDSIQRYVTDGWIQAPSELYYPIRLKPSGNNTLERLRQYGVNHIELRMFDLNPFAPAGVDVRDIKFAHLMMVWLASTPDQEIDERDQVNAIANYKNAAHYDLKTVRIIAPDGENYSVARAAKNVIGFMRDFYNSASQEVKNILDFEERKLIDPETRYSWQVRRSFQDGFVKKGLELAKEKQMEAIRDV